MLPAGLRQGAQTRPASSAVWQCTVQGQNMPPEELKRAPKQPQKAFKNQWICVIWTKEIFLEPNLPEMSSTYFKEGTAIWKIPMGYLKMRWPRTGPRLLPKDVPHF